jgi:hypothetical protein
MRRKPNKGQRYFPNSCEAIRNTPDKYFPSMPYQQFEHWKVYGYQIPDSEFAIIRMKDKDGQYQEKFYNTDRGAKNCINKCMQENKEIYMCTEQGMYHLKPDDLPTDFYNP